MTSKQQIASFNSLTQPQKRKVSRIITAVSAQTRLPVAQMMDGNDLRVEAADARRIAAFIIRGELPDLTMEHIGGIFDRAKSSISKDLQATYLKTIESVSYRTKVEAIRKEAA